MGSSPMLLVASTTLLCVCLGLLAPVAAMEAPQSPHVHVLDFSLHDDESRERFYQQQDAQHPLRRLGNFLWGKTEDDYVPYTTEAEKARCQALDFWKFVATDVHDDSDSGPALVNYDLVVVEAHGLNLAEIDYMRTPHYREHGTTSKVKLSDSQTKWATEKLAAGLMNHVAEYPDQLGLLPVVTMWRDPQRVALPPTQPRLKCTFKIQPQCPWLRPAKDLPQEQKEQQQRKYKAVQEENKRLEQLHAKGLTAQLSTTGGATTTTTTTKPPVVDVGSRLHEALHFDLSKKEKHHVVCFPNMCMPSNSGVSMLLRKGFLPKQVADDGDTFKSLTHLPRLTKNDVFEELKQFSTCVSYAAAADKTTEHPKQKTKSYYFQFQDKTGKYCVAERTVHRKYVTKAGGRYVLNMPAVLRDLNLPASTVVYLSMCNGGSEGEGKAHGLELIPSHADTH